MGFDLTTVVMTLLLALGAFGADAVWHPQDVILEASATGKLDKATVDVNMINTILENEVDRISQTPSIAAKPDVHLARQGGVAVAIASAVNMQSLIYAVQTRFGHQPDEIKIALFAEDGGAKVLVTGSGREQVATFEQEVVQQKGETIVALLHRAALIGMARIDPYLTALNLMERHAADKDFADVETLVNFAKSQLPPMPHSGARSLFENLQGILALFRDKRDDARRWFELAVQSDPGNAVAMLNMAFAELQTGTFRIADDRMEHLVHHLPSDPALAATAYMTLGAARAGLHDLNGADQALAEATKIDPLSATAWDLWADIKRSKGDTRAADALHRTALERSGNFENYAEVAALYFQLAWQDNQPVTRNKFINPSPVGLH
jgi:tetratricopeptide (TPR) repeat protein